MLPGLLLAYIPVKTYLKQTPARLLGWLLPLFAEAVPLLHTPVLVKASATRYRDGQAVGTLPPAEYAGYVRRLRDAGVSVFGGCCGTTPVHIAAMRAVLDEKKP